MAFKPEKLYLVRAGYAPSRKVPSDFEAPLDEISSSIGEVIWAWNYCHSAFHRLFAIIVSPQNLVVGLNIWHVIQNDSSQQQMVLVASRAALEGHKYALPRIEWAVERTDKLRERRNDVVHTATALQVTTGKFVADPISTRPSRARRLLGAQIHSDLPKLRGDLVAMANFINRISEKLSFPDQQPWPRKPQLLSIPASPKKPKKSTRRRQSRTRR